MTNRSKRRICVFTGTRAEYGILKPLIDLIKNDPDLELQLIVSGAHLSPEFGMTVQFIEQDLVPIAEKIDVLLSSDSTVGICKSMGLGLISYAESLQRLRPDMVVVLGDRYESFIFASTAMISKIPIAHISGGDRTEGAIDEAIRHSITKMSHLHFVSNEDSRKRVIQLGENPERVINAGAIGLDNLNELKLLGKEQLEQAINFKFQKRNLSVTFHPVTLENSSSKEQFLELLKACDEFPDIGLIFTKANADSDGRIINKLIDQYVLNRKNAVAFSSMGQINYLSSLKFVDGIIGNSSSGIYEAPSFKIGTINIGDRQKGRIQSTSVINCLPLKTEITKAINTLLTGDFKNTVNPYYKTHSAKSIHEAIKSIELKGILKKEFYDL
jgi:GDP/UDP-N,N'-diacetylbacillosamine 2-epimerase (hydrolysing)